MFNIWCDIPGNLFLIYEIETATGDLPLQGIKGEYIPFQRRKCTYNAKLCSVQHLILQTEKKRFDFSISFNVTSLQGSYLLFISNHRVIESGPK